MTPLHIAAQKNNIVGAKMLIEAGSKIMPRDDKGKTPLDYAESVEMIKLLKAHGAKEQ
jgi:ankyrin repeat protein